MISDLSVKGKACANDLYFYMKKAQQFYNYTRALCRNAHDDVKELQVDLCKLMNKIFNTAFLWIYPHISGNNIE
jgi:hypothetical protein